jgi:C1A family cysteine protease
MENKIYHETNDRRYYMGCIRDPKHADAPRLLTLKQAELLPASYIISDPTGIEDQGSLGSCTANAGDNVSKIRSAVATGTYFNGSRLALYKWARDHDGDSGDVGSSLSSMAWVLANVGVPPESAWPYNINQFDVEPPQSVKEAASKDVTTKETRLDASNQSVTLSNIKAAIAPNAVLPPCYPVMFGFDVPESFFNTGSSGNMPAPSGGIAGGHANVFIGYDDNHSGNYDGSKGALYVKNSWGTGWGANGLWWMPYSFFDNTSYEVGDCWAVITESDFPNNPPVSAVQFASTPSITL